MFGLSGNDSLFGDAGNDKLNGGTGADTFAFSAMDGIDKITDFNVSQGDRISLDKSFFGNVT